MLERHLSPPEAEDSYRQHFLKADAAQAYVIIAVQGIAGLAFARGDVSLIGIEPHALETLINRCLTGLVFVGVAVTLIRVKSGKTFDRAIIALLSATVLSSAHVLLLRSGNYFAYYPINLLLISVFWFVMPGPVASRAVAALTLSAVTVYSSRFAQIPHIGVRAMALAHVFAHVMGMPIAIRIARLRRERFHAQLEQERVGKQLAEEKDRAEKLARAKTEFLTTMSHEFRTPMNAVLGLSEVLEHSQLSSDQREIVRTIHSSADSLLGLLNDILDHAKIDSGHLTIHSAAIDVRELAETALTTVRLQANEKNIQLEFSCSPSIPRYISGDGSRVRQVLINLLSNAVKFTNTGKVSLSVAFEVTRNGEHEIKIQVQDTGVGISETNLERIFSPFEQAQETLGGGRGGTGLGLSISRNLAQLMGGSLSVSSTVGKGSTFEFRFPTNEMQAPDDASARQSVLRIGETPLRILIAEDNPTNQRVALAMLAQMREKADVVGNGKLAVEKLGQQEYDVILMDRHMPELDGLEATRRIRSLPLPGKRPHIIALTASAFAEDRAMCLEAGMDDFISKPMRLTDLRAALARARDQLSIRAESHEAIVPSTTEAESTIPVFDPAPLAQLRQLAGSENPHFVESLCADFIQHTESKLELFPHLIASADAPTLEREAHSLKSSSASLGALRLSKLCAEIEVHASNEQLDACLQLIPGLLAEFSIVKVELKRAAQLPD